MKRTYRDVLDAAVRSRVPDEVNLFPRISAQLESMDKARAFHARPALVVLAVLLALGFLSGVVYAVGRSLGYIPGMGIVEQGTLLRVLAEPVVVEREGITLTVTQGLADPEKTVIHYQVENIPEQALARDFMEGQTPTPRCLLSDTLRLPDATRLLPTGGQGRSWQLGFEYREIFGPLPTDVHEVRLLVACLLETAPGLAPENWEVPMTFVPAPPDMTVLPVIELTPSAQPTAAAGAEPTRARAPSPIAVERTVELEDGYILIGSFRSITTSDGVVTSPHVWSVRINNANGDEVAFDYASDIDLPPGDAMTSAWAYKLPGKTHAWPLTITLDTLEANLPDAKASFELDTGTSPRPGQQWALNLDLRIGRYPLRVLTATRTADGYSFEFQADPAITQVGVDILGPGQYAPPAGGGGGGGGDGSLSAGVVYAGQVPEGKLSVVVGNVTVSIPGPWSIQWRPEGAASQASPVPSTVPAACVTDDVWRQAKASAPSRIPSGLAGKFVLFGPSMDGSTYGVSVLHLDSELRQFLGKGSWPIVSPDGTRIVYTGDNGLQLYSLSSGVSQSLPNTDPSDYRMVWSPDGNRIAFIRSSSDQIMMIAVDGSAPQQVRDNSAVYHALAGWADNTHLLITEPGPEGVYVQSLDLADGSTQNLFTISSNKADTVVSQDGEWIAFTTSLGGMMGNGLYVSRLDTPERRLVAALDGRALYFPIWSPDHRWLILGLPDPDDPADGMAQALVDLETCQLIPLPEIGGEVFSWGR